MNVTAQLGINFLLLPPILSWAQNGTSQKKINIVVKLNVKIFY